MHPFVVFALILLVIWTLSGIASWVNKQQEAERRRRVRMEIERGAARGGSGSARPPQQPAAWVVEEPPPLHVPPWAQEAVQPQQWPPARISEGIAQRHPDVLLPPAPPPPLPARRAQPKRPQQQQRRQQAAPKKPRRQQQQPAQRAMFQEEAPAPAVAPPLTRPTITAPARPAAAAAGPQVDAGAVSRWLKPNTLRRQFILTEVFQPPVALRPDRYE